MLHAGAGKEDWWEARGQLPFACTGCGKCCQVYGDVWCAPGEVAGLMEFFAMTREEVVASFGKMEVDGWLLLKDRSLPGGSQGCVFLSEDKKTCRVYEQRPAQCRVYPFFPRIMKTPEVVNSRVPSSSASDPCAPSRGTRRLCVRVTLRPRVTEKGRRRGFGPPTREGARGCR